MSCTQPEYIYIYIYIYTQYIHIHTYIHTYIRAARYIEKLIAINAAPCAMCSRSACYITLHLACQSIAWQYIWPIRWSPAALDNKLKILRSLMGFSDNELFGRRQQRENLELRGGSVKSCTASSQLNSIVENSSDQFFPRVRFI